jgi:hypothetical protein
MDRQWRGEICVSTHQLNKLLSSLRRLADWQEAGDKLRVSPALPMRAADARDRKHPKGFNFRPL